MLPTDPDYHIKWAKEHLSYVHGENRCKGEYCCIHNPSDHHMRTWPLNWRNDTGVMERICPHGVGHPDPDDAAFNIRMNLAHMNIHGCDGCCRRKEQAQYEISKN